VVRATQDFRGRNAKRSLWRVERSRLRYARRYAPGRNRTSARGLEAVRPSRRRRCHCVVHYDRASDVCHCLRQAARSGCQVAALGSHRPARVRVVMCAVCVREL
jgi:hypothetical protein